MAISFLQSTSSTADLTTYTFSSQNLGTAASDRIIVVCVTSRGTAGDGMLSITIGGVAAALIDAGTGGHLACIGYALVPTGTTGDVVVTHNAARLRCGIGVYRLTGYSTTPTDTDIASGTTSSSGSVSVVDGGAWVGAGYGGGTGLTTVTWSSGEDYDSTIETFVILTGAHGEEVTATTVNQTLTIDSGSAHNSRLALVSFAPASGSIVPILHHHRQRRLAS